MQSLAERVSLIRAEQDMDRVHDMKELRPLDGPRRCTWSEPDSLARCGRIVRPNGRTGLCKTHYNVTAQYEIRATTGKVKKSPKMLAALEERRRHHMAAVERLDAAIARQRG